MMAYAGRSSWPNHEEARDLQRELIQDGCSMLKFEPAIYREEAGRYRIPLIERSFTDGAVCYTQSRATIFAGHTFVINLGFSEEELLSHMKQKTRYNIKLAQKRGVIVKDTTHEQRGLDEFFSLYIATIQRQHYFGRGHDYMRILWDELKDHMARMYTAYYENTPLASYMVFFFKHHAYYVYGGSSIEHKEVMASNLLMWEVMRDAKKRGCDEFDMWGALPKEYNEADPWAGFHRFKEGYGGRHRSFIPAIDMVLDPLRYALFDIAWPVRNALLQALTRLY